MELSEASRDEDLVLGFDLIAVVRHAILSTPHMIGLIGCGTHDHHIVRRRS